MVFRYGYDLREHAMYPGKYFITRDGQAVPNEFKKPMKRLTLRAAHRRISQLIKSEDRKVEVSSNG
jgi:hypothetical protein